jgi:hypothetical protein
MLRGMAEEALLRYRSWSGQQTSTVSLPDPHDSQLNDFLNEIHLIALFEPSIVERIDEDLDLHAKKKSCCA